MEDSTRVERVSTGLQSAAFTIQPTIHVAPPVRLELTIFRLTGGCCTNSATEKYLAPPRVVETRSCP